VDGWEGIWSVKGLSSYLQRSRSGERRISIENQIIWVYQKTTINKLHCTSQLGGRCFQNYPFSWGWGIHAST